MKTLREMESDYIEKIMDLVGGKRVEAAKILGLCTRTLNHKIRKIRHNSNKPKSMPSAKKIKYDKIYDCMIKNKFNFYKVALDMGVNKTKPCSWFQILKSRGYYLPKINGRMTVFEKRIALRKFYDNRFNIRNTESEHQTVQPSDSAS